MILDQEYYYDYYIFNNGFDDLKVGINDKFYFSDFNNINSLSNNVTIFESSENYLVYENTGSIKKNFEFNNKILSDEPYGVGIHISFLVLIFNELGFRMHYSLILLLISFFMILFSKILFKNYLVGYISIIFFLLNGLIYLSHEYNPTILAVLVLMASVFFIFKYFNSLNTFSLVLSGLLYGFLGCIRPVCLLFLPIFLLYIYKKRKKGCIIFLFCAFFAAMPNFFINSILYLNFLKFPGFVFNPSFEHSFFGIKFYIKTLLNYPFYYEIIRSPDFSYPNLINFPLILLNSVGLVVFTAFFVNVKHLFRRKKGLILSMTLIFILFLMANENWKLTKNYLVLLVLPFFLLLSFDSFYHFLKNFKTKVITYFMFSILVFSAFSFLLSLDFPIDDRIIERDSFFENSSINFQKKEFAKISFLPKIFLPKIFFPKIFLNDSHELFYNNHYPECIDANYNCLENEVVITDFFLIQKNGIYLLLSIDIKKNHNPDFKFVNISLNNNSVTFYSGKTNCYTYNLSISSENSNVIVNLFTFGSNNNLPEGNIIRLNGLDNFTNICWYLNGDFRDCLSLLTIS